VDHKTAVTLSQLQLVRYCYARSKRDTAAAVVAVAIAVAGLFSIEIAVSEKGKTWRYRSFVRSRVFYAPEKLIPELFSPGVDVKVGVKVGDGEAIFQELSGCNLVSKREARVSMLRDR